MRVYDSDKFEVSEKKGLSFLFKACIEEGVERNSLSGLVGDVPPNVRDVMALGDEVVELLDDEELEDEDEEEDDAVVDVVFDGT